MRIEGTGSRTPAVGGHLNGQEDAGSQRFVNSLMKGLKEPVNTLLDLPPSDRKTVQTWLGDFADQGNADIKSKLASGKINVDVYNALSMIYVLCQVVSKSNDDQLINLSGATSDVNQLTDLNRQITDAVGKTFRDLIGNYSGKDQSGIQSELTANYQAFTAAMQSQLSMFTQGASQVSTAASTLQQNTSSMMQFFTGLTQAVSQSVLSFLRT